MTINEVVEEQDIVTSSKYPRLFPATALSLLILIAGSFAFFKFTDHSNIAAKAEAHALYVRARALWQTRDAQDLHEATVLLERSVFLDPSAARAHAALADAYAFDFTNWKRAEDEANEAIRLDGNFGEPHASIGFVRMFWQWDFARAEAEFKRAIDLSPDYATAHQWLAINYAISAQKDAALWEIDYAWRLEPGSLSINSDRCQLFYFSRRYDEGSDQCRRALDIGRSIDAHDHLYDIYIAQGRYREAVDEYLATASLRTRGADEGTSLREAFAQGGIIRFWRELLNRQQRALPSYYQLAKTCARLNDQPQAVKWLVTAYKNHDPELIYLVADPVFDEYHIGRNDLPFLNEFLHGS
jgi:serine/threonine-protein kinase